ncbi:hypothetical protein PT974_07756 [Cladobotryum mycophilum]|uniref:Uncharacterized protein n=1 Tax=Cladobotryum mycophilum TaxID=491253 RepID=A0ABR0SHT8_9HYPO
MKSFSATALLVLGMLQAAAASPGPSLFSRAADVGFCACSNGALCQGDTPQCTQDNKGAVGCCPSGTKALNGVCRNLTANLCSDDTTICDGATAQCTPDNKGAQLCCAPNMKGINGQCMDLSSNLCSDGTTICSGGTPQCTVDVSVYADSTGGASSPTVCCANGQKSLNGKCYARGAKLIPCYQDGPCDWGAGYYCAWNAGNADSKCCKLDQYYKGTQCVQKP